MSLGGSIETRVLKLNESAQEGKCVLYVMSRDQRVQDNIALVSAQKHALSENLPFAVVFCLQPKTGVRSREHYEFMLNGLKQVENDLKQLEIPFIMLVGPSYERLAGLFHHVRPVAVYFDFSPLRGPKKLLEHLSGLPDSPSIYLVDNHNIVPVWVTSDKQEIGARTIRTKIHKKLEQYLVEPDRPIKHPVVWPGVVKTIDDLQELVSGVLDGISPSGIKIKFQSGEKSALDELKQFIQKGLSTYAKDRNDPGLNGQSDLSPYLHFGQISSLRVVLQLRETALKLGGDLHLLASSKMPQPEDSVVPELRGINALVEELVVRKELADNFCYFNENYDSIESAAGWARNSLDKHRNDPRQELYSLEELETTQTHDPAWNAAQKQLTATGKMHGYMRMYWAKKVLEWSPSRADVSGALGSFLPPDDMDGTRSTATHTSSTKEKADNAQLISPSKKNPQSPIPNLQSLSGAEWAIEVLKYLNDHYSIDGGDPNGYAGIMWSVAGVHDRPWSEREIFGMIRYMNYGGLKRKFDIQEYERLWN